MVTGEVTTMAIKMVCCKDTEFIVMLVAGGQLPRPWGT